jgi:hypothetical protein
LFYCSAWLCVVQQVAGCKFEISSNSWWVFAQFKNCNQDIDCNQNGLTLLKCQGGTCIDPSTRCDLYPCRVGSKCDLKTRTCSQIASFNTACNNCPTSGFKCENNQCVIDSSYTNTLFGFAIWFVVLFFVLCLCSCCCCGYCLCMAYRKNQQSKVLNQEIQLLYMGSNQANGRPYPSANIAQHQVPYYQNTAIYPPSSASYQPAIQGAYNASYEPQRAANSQYPPSTNPQYPPSAPYPSKRDE